MTTRRTHGSITPAVVTAVVIVILVIVGVAYFIVTSDNYHIKHPIHFVIRHILHLQLPE